LAANNGNMRRNVVDIVRRFGPMNQEQVMGKLEEFKIALPSPNSLSSILSKSSQIKAVGKERLKVWVKGKKEFTIYDVDRRIIKCWNDILYSSPLNMLSKTEKASAERCPDCGRKRVFRPGDCRCISCLRVPKWWDES